MASVYDENGALLIAQLRLAPCLTPAAMRGLIGRSGIAASEALLLHDPLGAIHTFGMRCVIDVVFLDRDNRIISISPSMPPRRLRLVPRSRRQLELADGGAQRLGLKPGQRLVIA